ncbi:MAG: AAA family ATPase [Solirubrobacterales bacterium]|nr:AAA family ATPase [Solirubrobacterales bacterium]MBV9366544.1 AAA family ATPase [Solirubrobacterales bacterium]MBV9680591.1 AAA family ATPase [Solirubrobacterales bacterium]MBV9810268.1 AAA family ATPase [Solirubrobacterales bacterium]
MTAIAAQKGGTGKTALAGSLGSQWAYAGFRTLLVDLDQQANLTFAYGVDPAALEATVVDVLAPRNAVPAEDAVLHDVLGVPRLDLLPCDERAEALDTQLRSETMGVFKLNDALEPLLSEYDRVLMDCPPNVGELTVSALLLADEIVCPIKMGDSNALRGLSRLTQTVEKLNRRGAEVRFKSLVRVECDHAQLSYRLNQQALQRLARRLKLRVARTELRARAAWRTAITQDVPLILLDERDRSTREAQADVHNLARELWPRVKFPSPSEIKTQRRASAASDRKAA